MSLTSDDLADIKQLMEATIGAAMKEQDGRLEKRFDAIDKRFDGIDNRLDGIDSRLDGIDNRLDDMDVKLDTIADAVGVEFEKHEDKLGNHEVRIVRLEKRAA